MTTSERYDPKEIEPKWQERWEREGLYRTDLRSGDPGKNYYNLSMFPYPSGELHTGHLYMYTGPDINARYKRALGYNVFTPFGYDSFGLPAENAAIKHNVHPRIWTEANIEKMTGQMKRLGTTIDWNATLQTHSPEYYRWNQWFFLKFRERGLAYRQFAPVDWCPSCNTTLAREQVKGEERLCDRCGTPVIKKDLFQWKFRITAYAEELLEGLNHIDWPERIKIMQRNWIGRATGANIRFPLQLPGGADGQHIEVFTTRPDTIYGATFMVLAPEHPLVGSLTTDEFRDAVEQYRLRASRETEIERLATDKDKTGVFTGGYAINPASGEAIPVWIGDYVLATYGTGAVMAVPSGDQRDFEFATKYGLPIPPVVLKPGSDPDAKLTEAYAGPGVMINSGPLNGLVTLAKFTRDEWTPALAAEYGVDLGKDDDEANERIIAILKEKGAGESSITYRLRDWLVSRQRFWGTPIPIIHCPKCGEVGVPYDQLPVELPMDVDFRPTGESPLKFHDGFRKTTCPACGGEAERDTDTMDTFVDSSWYYYRYLSPHLESGAIEPDLTAAWMPVEQYMGGAEHAVMHLLYARFWTKVMRDMGLVDVDEPFTKLTNQGIILGPDGHKMSKSRGNVVRPDVILEQHGTDAVRGYLMFISPWDQGGPFQMTGIEGISRFYHRVWDLMTTSVTVDGDPAGDDIQSLQRDLHNAIRRVQEAYDGFTFNLAIAALMEFSNSLRDARKTAVVNAAIWREALDTFLILLAPIAPHLTEELWERRGHEFSIHQQPWPKYDADLAREATFELILQFNGKVRDRLVAPVGVSEEQARALALESKIIKDYLAGRDPKRVLYVPGRLVNVVA